MGALWARLAPWPAIGRQADEGSRPQTRGLPHTDALFSGVRVQTMRRKPGRAIESRFYAWVVAQAPRPAAMASSPSRDGVDAVAGWKARATQGV